MPSGPSKRRISRPLNSLKSWPEKASARHVPDVQLEQRVVVRRRRERKAATAAVLQQEVDVLPGEKLQPLVRRQLEADDRHVRRGLVDRLDAARQLPDPDVAGPPDFANFDDQVRERFRAAEERKACAPFVLGQRRGLVGAVVDPAVENLPLAGAAGTVAAAVGKDQVRGHRGSEHRVVLGAGERMIAGLYGNLKRHGRFAWAGVHRTGRPSPALTRRAQVTTAWGECDPGLVDWLRRRRAAHRRPASAQGSPVRAHPPPRGHSQAARARDCSHHRRSRPVCEPLPTARGAFRCRALRAAAVRRTRRSADAEADRRADAGAKHTTALRLHLDLGRVRRLCRCARDRDAGAPRPDAPRSPSCRRRGPPAGLGEALWRRARDPARAGDLRSDALAPRPDPAGHPGAGAGRRHFHQSHSRRRSGARGRRGALPRQAQSRLQRHR